MLDGKPLIRVKSFNNDEANWVLSKFNNKSNPQKHWCISINSASIKHSIFYLIGYFYPEQSVKKS